jgi:hypothetical protein
MITAGGATKAGGSGGEPLQACLGRRGPPAGRRAGRADKSPWTQSQRSGEASWSYLRGSPSANRSTTVIIGTTPDDDHGHSPSFGSLVVLEVVYHVGEVGSGGSLGGTGSSHRKVTQHRVQWGDRNAMCSDQFKFVRELGYTVYQVKLPT